MNQKSAIALLSLNGWTQVRGGKHAVKMVKPGARPVTLPRHNGSTYGKGLASAILKQAGIPKDQA
jgi:predicted RNA binding protein YcfA (HicA-like mRNA interferase family)